MNREEFEYARMFASALDCYVVDCVLVNDLVVLIVKGNIGKIVGYKGCIVRVFQNLWAKRIKIVKDSENPEKFIKNYYFGTNVKIERNADSVKIYLPQENFGKYISRNGVKAEALRKILKRRFNIKNVKFLPIL